MIGKIKSIVLLLAIVSILPLLVAPKKFGRKTKAKGQGSYQNKGHNYPPSDGYSGGSGHNYPPSNGMSGSGNSFSNTYNAHNYPPSGGLSGHGQGNAYGQGSAYNKNRYQYSPPQQVHYTPHYGAAPQYFPAYVGPPSPYADRARSSNSRFGTLLTGLTLLNLGLTGASLLSHSGRHSSHHVTPQTVCYFKIEDGSDVEITKIPCDIITSFMDEEHSIQHGNIAQNEMIENQTIAVDPLEVKGPEVDVKSTTKCSVQMRGPERSFTHTVDCRLLMEYAQQSYRLNGATKESRSICSVLFVTLLYLII